MTGSIPTQGPFSSPTTARPGSMSVLSSAPKTILIYRGLLHLHIAPYFANVTVAEVTLARVRRWRKKLLDSGVSEVTAAKAYRLLRAIFNTALDDGLIRRNPYRIKGAGEEESAERPVLTVAQAYALADAVGLRYRALILLAAFTSLRWAEVVALTPTDIDLDARTVRVVRQLNYYEKGGTFGPPKSRAGVRTVPFPELIVDDVRATTCDGSRPRCRSSSPPRREHRSRTRTSGNATGFPRWPLSAWKASIFTTCATPAISSLPTQAPTSGN